MVDLVKIRTLRLHIVNETPNEDGYYELTEIVGEEGYCFDIPETYVGQELQTAIRDLFGGGSYCRIDDAECFANGHIQISVNGYPITIHDIREQIQSDFELADIYLIVDEAIKVCRWVVCEEYRVSFHDKTFD